MLTIRNTLSILAVMTTLHVLAPFHSRVLANNSQCAFAGGNVLRFSKMMKQHGFKLVEYHAGSVSDSLADEHVAVTSTKEWTTDWGNTEGQGASPDITSPGASRFQANLMNKLYPRVKRGDIVCHSYGDAYSMLPFLLPVKVRHVEIAIGYERGPFGADRIFPSQAWRHYHFGKYGHSVEAMLRSAVIPHYFDPKEWTVTKKSDDFVLYCARLHKTKYGRLPELVRYRDDLKWKIAGVGDTAPFEGLKNVELLGAVKGKARDKLFGAASCIVCPTEFVEPFGAVAIEAAFTGTPVVAPNYGAYVETIPGIGELVNGAKIEDWGDAIDSARGYLATSLQGRAHVAKMARETFSLQTVGKRYADYFNRLPEPPGA